MQSNGSDRLKGFLVLTHAHIYSIKSVYNKIIINT